MKIRLFSLLVSITILACNKPETRAIIVPEPVSEPAVKKDPSPRKILALGDSYTIGAGVVAADRWTSKLVGLNNQNYNFTKHTVIAKSGWTTSNLINGIENEKPAKEYDLVTLLIGVNNQYQNLSFALFEKEFVELVQTAQSLAIDKQPRLLVLSIPDWSKSPFGKSAAPAETAEEINQYNAFIKNYCAQNNIALVDVTTITRSNLDRQYFTLDDLHYTGTMHQLWAEAAQNETIKILKLP
jgi:lysophospholipase L1-like esterase